MNTIVVRLLVAGLALLAVGLVSGCGARAQVAAYKSGKSQAKPDTKPWDNDPGTALYTTSKWTGGDQASWETALRTRAQGQNEYNRVQ